MADVEGEAEGVRVVECVAEVVEVGDGGEELAGFGFDGERDACCGGRVQDGGEGVGQSVPGGVLVSAAG